MHIFLGMLLCFTTQGANLKSDIQNLSSPYNDTPNIIETKDGLDDCQLNAATLNALFARDRILESNPEWRTIQDYNIAADPFH